MPGLVDDSVVTGSADGGSLYSAAHELVACLRSWLQRVCIVQVRPARVQALLRNALLNLGRIDCDRELDTALE